MISTSGLAQTTYPLTPSLVREGEDGLEGASPLPKILSPLLKGEGIKG